MKVIKPYFMPLALLLCNTSALISQGQITRIPLDKIEALSELPDELTENSGILMWGDGSLIGHNDSGARPELYQFTLDGTLFRTIRVAGAKHRDWEDITADDNYLYIGDFGNNYGNRKNLRIYRIPHPNGGANSIELEAESTSFRYADQTKFNISSKHNFDCEAMINIDEYLYLFTKNRGDQQTNCYAIPKEPGDYTLERLGSFDAGGLITGADYRNGMLVLVGYNHIDGMFRPFIWLFWEFDDDAFFSGRSARTDLPLIVQAEAIMFDSDDSVIFTNEEEEGGIGTLYRIAIDDLRHE